MSTFRSFAMRLTIGILSLFFLIITIGAPPVVEKPEKDKQNVDNKNDDSDEAVRPLIYKILILFFLFV